MTPPIVDASSNNSSNSNVVYQNQMRYSNARMTTKKTTTITTTATAANGSGRDHHGGTYGNYGNSKYTSPTKPQMPIAAAATPATVHMAADDSDSFDDYAYAYGDGNQTTHVVDDLDDEAAASADDVNSEFATAEAVAATAPPAVNSTGVVRDPGLLVSPTGYQVPGGRGFAPAPPVPVPPEASPAAATRTSSNATLKSGYPARSPGDGGDGDGDGGYGGTANKKKDGIGNGGGGPPISTVKTKPKKKKKKKKSSRSQKYERQIAAEAAVARYYAEEEPFDCGDPMGNPVGGTAAAVGGGGGNNPLLGAGVAAGHVGRTSNVLAGIDAATSTTTPIRQPRPVRPEVAPTTAAAAAAAGLVPPTRAVNGGISGGSKPYERMYYAETGGSTPAMHTNNPFDDSFDTAAASNVPPPLAVGGGASSPTTPTINNNISSSNNNNSSNAPSTSSSAIRAVRARHHQYQQEQEQLQQQQQRKKKQQQQKYSSINRAASTDTNGVGRAEKSPTPTNANVSVPRAPAPAPAPPPLSSSAIPRVGPMDEMTITSAGTGESWKRAEEEFAAAEAAARSERARWGQQAESDDDDDDGEYVASPAPSVSFDVDAAKKYAGGSPKRPSGILKTSTASRSKGRDHPWDKKGPGTPDREGDNDTLFDFEDDRADPKARGQRKKAKRRASTGRGIKKSMSHDSALSAGSGRRRGASRGKSDDDDESQSTAPGLTLQDRTQEAWKRKKGGSGYEVARSRSAPRAGRSGSAVAFTKDTIHHFENDDQSTVTKDDSLVSAKHRRGRRGDEAYSDDDTYYSRRTTATDYSNIPKSYESEVEDLVKDFLFIGRGRKTVPGVKRHHSDYRKYPNDDNDDSTFDGTFATNDESTFVTKDESTYVTRDESTYVTRDSVDEETLESQDISKAGRKSASKRSRGIDEDDETLISVDVVKKSNPCGQENCEDNPLSVVWEFVEGGLDAMSQALGLSEAKPESTSTKAVSSSSKRQQDDNQSLSGLMDYAADAVYGENSSEMGSRTVSPSPSQSMDASVDKEAGLVELSLCAAKAKHMTAGVPFDDNKEIDVVNEIKFNVITTSLPLGLLFQENSAGCWVAKVFTTGSAANNVIGKSVEIGDQLAAVNGNSTIKLTVDEVCDMISSSPDSEEIELTFLRYIGPLNSQKANASVTSPSPLRRSKGSGLFRGARSGAGRGGAAAPSSTTTNADAAAPHQKQKRGFSLVRSRSKQKKVDAPAPAPVPAVSASTSSDFLGENDDTDMFATSTTSQAAGEKKKKKKLPFFGRKKKSSV